MTFRAQALSRHENIRGFSALVSISDRVGDRLSLRGGTSQLKFGRRYRLIGPPILHHLFVCMAITATHMLVRFVCERAMVDPTVGQVDREHHRRDSRIAVLLRTGWLEHVLMAENTIGVETICSRRVAGI